MGFVNSGQATLYPSNIHSALPTTPSLSCPFTFHTIPITVTDCILMYIFVICLVESVTVIIHRIGYDSKDDPD